MGKVILRVLLGFIILFGFYTIHFVSTRFLVAVIPEAIYDFYRIASSIFFSILGGFFTARIAKVNHWVNVRAVAGLTLIYMLLNIPTIAPGEEAFYIISTLAMVGGICLGGYLFIRKIK